MSDVLTPMPGAAWTAIGFGLASRGPLPAPVGSLTAIGLVEVIKGALLGLTVFSALSALDATMWANLQEGLLSQPVRGLGRGLVFCLIPLLCSTAAASATLSATLRRRGFPGGLMRLVLVVVAGDIVISWVLWLLARAVYPDLLPPLDPRTLLAAAMATLAGAAAGAAVPLRTASWHASLVHEWLERVPLISAATGAHTWFIGLASRIISISRIAPLTMYGDAAPPAPELTRELLHVLEGWVPLTFAAGAVEVFVIGLAARLIWRACPPPAP